ncbi:hypothetical protein L3Y34_009630 [Caenorhabditis briggsae]|uniref:Uncharacterized protein n=1 Tax=Caenorhabditis briggsae TaxID=6238 RepID=A0AAE9A995_CAEBR|nr:hypothetical protein L3Y34_009630 [Caenorhabditis briggsae]
MEVVPAGRRSEMCSICNVRAHNGFSYGAYCCNACKMFFRRVLFVGNLEPSGMTYTPSEIDMNNTDPLTAWIFNLKHQETHREFQLLNCLFEGDPTVKEVSEIDGPLQFRPRPLNHPMDLGEWVFITGMTSLNFLKRFTHVSMMNPADKANLLKYTFFDFSIFSDAIRANVRNQEFISFPDGTEVVEVRVDGVTETFLNGIRCRLAARVNELRVTQEEFMLLTQIFFCNPALPNLTVSGRGMLNTYQKIYTSALLRYCFLTYQQSAPARFTDLLSIFQVIVSTRQDISHLFYLNTMQHPILHMLQPTESPTYDDSLDLPEILNSPDPQKSRLDSSGYSIIQIPPVVFSKNLSESFPEDVTSSESTSSGVKESRRTVRPTECSVCGLPANGYHYDVPSCNGCKTFFRRMCLSEKSFQCKGNNDCFDLNKRATPLKCRFCRHQKCISAGMNPLAMELDQKQAESSNFKKLIKRKEIKQEQPDDDDNDCQVVQVINSQKSKNVIKMMDSMENKLQKSIDMLIYLEAKVEKFRKSAYNPKSTEITGIEFLLQTESRIAYADRYEPMPNWPLPPQPHRKPFFPTGMKEKGPKHHPDRKNWLFFNLLESKDQFILIKHVTLACMNLHISFSSVQRKFAEPIHPDGSPTPYFDETHYDAMVMSVAPLIRCQVQSVEYLLLKAICLCNPAVPDLSPNAQKTIAIEREKYADALFDHCLRNRSPAHFAQLMQIFDLLERQQRMQKDIHLLYVASKLAKLPKECAIRVIEDIMDN